MENQPIIDRAITMVLSGTINRECVETMKMVSSSTEAAEIFVRTLIARKGEAGNNIDSILPEVQQLLESIADHSKSTACIFMAYLWPIASLQIGMHDVVDSIDLWLANYDGPEIIEHLRYIATTADSGMAREHFQQLLVGIA